jgi:hypothetical protein
LIDAEKLLDRAVVENVVRAADDCIRRMVAELHHAGGREGEDR